MKVLVTGGAGFLGGHLVRALVAAGHEVVAFDNLRRGAAEVVDPGACFIAGDIRDIDALGVAVAGAELVFHLAAQSNVLGAFEDFDYSFTTNVSGTVNVLKAASSAGARRVVFSSSREVYGEQAALPVKEDAALNAKNPYGASKLAGEAYCRAWPTLAPLEVAVLRFGNLYGPGDRDRVIPLWIAKCLRGDPIELFGGEQVLDFVPVGMAVAALLAAATADIPGPVNVGTGVATSLPDLARRILALTGNTSELLLRPARSAEVVRFVADTTAMRAVLGIEPPADPLCELPALVELSRAA